MRSGTTLKHRLSIKLPEQNKLQQNVLPSTMWGKNPGLWLDPGFSSFLCRKQLFAKAGERLEGARRGLVGRGDHTVLDEGNEADIRSRGPGR